ncbi:uncharacterized protein LOC106076696 isoform X3 [Biomphalaria glabrata]|uniref:Uncharacterized protein LOC106076696 isoform X3 n=1 Tax=Biomphalaria glabrata TaxID=6526 RepID=A0A9W3ARX1_BIOGL|nr:uncharacterized protein LOC106076696 isoform X3 [Biomphalaria glabrata]
MAFFLHLIIFCLVLFLILSAPTNQEKAQNENYQNVLDVNKFGNGSKEKLSHSMINNLTMCERNISFNQTLNERCICVSQELCLTLNPVTNDSLNENFFKAVSFLEDLEKNLISLVTMKTVQSNDETDLSHNKRVSGRFKVFCQNSGAINLKTRRTVCHSPLPTRGFTIERFHDRNSLRSNITYEYSYHDKTTQTVVKAVLYLLTILMISRRISFKVKLSENKNPSLISFTSHDKFVDLDIYSMLKSYTDKKIDISSIFKDSDASLFALKTRAFSYLRNCFAYPVFNMARLASYRHIASAQSPVSFVELSEAGFRYSGQESIVCESCLKSNPLMSVVSSPSNAVYHSQGCVRIKSATSTEESPDRGASCIDSTATNQQETVSSFTSSIGELLPTVLAYFQELANEVQEYSFNVPRSINTDLFRNQFSRNACNRNSAAHAKYFPLESLNIQSLPRENQDELVFQLVKILAKLTVKIECTENNTCGSGYIVNYACKELSTNELQAVPSLNGKLGDLVHQQKLGVIYVQTTSHVVLDGQGVVRDTEVTLSLDNNIYKNVKLSGKSVLFHSKKGIFQSILICLTPDLNIIRTLDKLQNDLIDHVKRIPNSLKESMSQSVYVISHPHGEEKMLSFGKALPRNYIIFSDNERGDCLVELKDPLKTSDLDENKRTALVYDSLTCNGSSGALVITFKRSSDSSDWRLDIWTHNAINDLDEMGVAAPREYLLVSGRSITRSQDGASNLPAPNVLSSAGVPPPQSLNGDFPLYPMYSRLQKRRESLQSWMFSNILDPNMLAQIGFFYAGYGDCVRCFQCGLGLRSWKLGDDVLVEHTKFRPSCSLLQSILARRNSNSTNEDQSPAQTAAPLNDSNGLDTPKFQMLLAPRSTQNTAVNTEQPSSTQSNAIGQSSLPEGSSTVNQLSYFFTATKKLHQGSREKKSKFITIMHGACDNNIVTQKIIHKTLYQLLSLVKEI